MSVIELTARYRLGTDDLSATVTLTGDFQIADEEADEAGLDHDDEPTCLTLLHERLAKEVASYDFLDTFTLSLDVCASETLTIIARRHGRVIGSLVNEVNTSETSRVLLCPKGGFNVIVYQEREQSPENMREEIETILASIRL